MSLKFLGDTRPTTLSTSPDVTSDLSMNSVSSITSTCTFHGFLSCKTSIDGLLITCTGSMCHQDAVFSKSTIVKTTSVINAVSSPTSSTHEPGELWRPWLGVVSVRGNNSNVHLKLDETVATSDTYQDNNAEKQVEMEYNSDKSEQMLEHQPTEHGSLLNKSTETYNCGNGKVITSNRSLMAPVSIQCVRTNPEMNSNMETNTVSEECLTFDFRESDVKRKTPNKPHSPYVPRNRTTFTSRQKSCLDYYFKHFHGYIHKSETFVEIAKLIDLDPQQVKIWFQNKRSRLKKEGKPLCRYNYTDRCTSAPFHWTTSIFTNPLESTFNNQLTGDCPMDLGAGTPLTHIYHLSAHAQNERSLFSYKQREKMSDIGSIEI